MRDNGKVADVVHWEGGFAARAARRQVQKAQRQVSDRYL